VPADGLHPGGRSGGQSRQHQEGPVSRARGHEAGRRQGEGREQGGQRDGMRARCRPSATTTSCPDMRALAIMRDTGCPSCSMRRTRCRCQADKARRRAASASSCRCCARAAVAAGVSGRSWRRIRSPRRRCPTVPMRGRCRACGHCWRRWSSSTRQ
jgi:hypothetical protein